MKSGRCGQRHCDFFHYFGRFGYRHRGFFYLVCRWLVYWDLGLATGNYRDDGDGQQHAGEHVTAILRGFHGRLAITALAGTW